MNTEILLRWAQLSPKRNRKSCTIRTLRSPESGQEHLLGTDDLIRDVAAIMSYGLFTTISIGVMASALVLLIGVAARVLNGMLRGVVEVVLMRLATFSCLHYLSS